jgi:hypothetical protein
VVRWEAVRWEQFILWVDAGEGRWAGTAIKYCTFSRLKGVVYVS